MAQRRAQGAARATRRFCLGADRGLLVAGCPIGRGAERQSVRGRGARSSPPAATVRLPKRRFKPVRRRHCATGGGDGAGPSNSGVERAARQAEQRRQRPSKIGTIAKLALAGPREEKVRQAPAGAAQAGRPVSAGAGRVARIGTSSRRQAKKGWWAIVRHYPGMRRLKAVVAPVQSQRNGRTFYRLQFGTTSQAHSEVLCQRMRIIGQSCVVVGLPPRSSAAKGRGGVRG